MQSLRNLLHSQEKIITSIAANFAFRKDNTSYFQYPHPVILFLHRIIDRMNEMDRPSHLSKPEKIEVIDWLAEHFPAAFFKHKTEIKPLKIGVFEDILDFYERLDTPPFSKKCLKEALNYYSSSPAYLTTQQENRPRVDLYGNEVEMVTAQQAKYAHEKFKARFAAR